MRPAPKRSSLRKEARVKRERRRESRVGDVDVEGGEKSEGRQRIMRAVAKAPPGALFLHC